MRPPNVWSSSIEDVREGIDALGREVITKLGRRVSYAETAARFKPANRASAL